MNDSINIMLDLETKSTHPLAAIKSIGAVIFDEEGLHQEFYTNVTDTDGHISSDTMIWWEQQGDEAKKAFEDPKPVDLEAALLEFSSWALSFKKDILLWGNGAGFDNVILANAYKRCYIKTPWEHWSDRCFRTIKNFANNIHVNIKFEGFKHHALDDAKHQARHMVRFLLHEQWRDKLEDMYIAQGQELLFAMTKIKLLEASAVVIK